jgi:hypothetical protein
MNDIRDQRSEIRYNFQLLIDKDFDQIPNIKKWSKIYHEKYNEKWESETKKFNEFCQTQPENISKKLTFIRNLIKQNLDQETKNITTISNTFLMDSLNLEINNKNEFIELNNLNHIFNSKVLNFACANIINCGDITKFTENLLTQFKINNCTITSQPNHAFNIFEIEGEFYFFDMWAGGIINEFNPKAFFKNCDIGGIYDFKISKMHYMLFQNGFNVDKFKNIVEEINHSLKENDEIKNIVKDRLINYINSLQKNNYNLHCEIENLEKIQENLIKKNNVFGNDLKSCRDFIQKFSALLYSLFSTTLSLKETNFNHSNSSFISIGQSTSPSK